MRKLIAFMIIVLLAVTGIGYCFNVTNLKLQSDILELKIRIDTLNSSINDLGSLIDDLNRSINGLLDFYEKVREECDSLVKCFFIQDSDFSIPLNESVWWGVEAWHGNSYSICEIRNGALHLVYNGTIDYEYGNSGVFQGRHADGRFTHQLLVGSSSDDAFFGDYAIFPKSIGNGKLRLETRFRIANMEFTLYPVNYSHPNYSRVNLGMTLMCAINNEPLNLTAQTLWLDVYFAGYCLNTTNIWVIPKNEHYVAYNVYTDPNTYDNDVHAGYFVGEVNAQDFGKWIEISIDLGDYISRTLDLITWVDIKTIRVYGFIVFVECLGAYAEVEYDYVKTTRI